VIKLLIYLLYVYDLNNIPQLLCASLSEDNVKNIIIEEILYGNITYKEHDSSPERQVSIFENDFSLETINYINNNLAGGFYNCVIDGEKQVR